MICLDGGGLLLRKGCACRGSAALAHARCLARAAASHFARRGERAWSECQTCGQHFTGRMTIALAVGRQGRCPATRSFHATALQNAGAYAEAERIFRDVLDVRIARHGPTHKATLEAMGKLASALLSSPSEDKRAESETLWRDVHAVRARTLGTEHPLTLSSKASLVLSLSRALTVESVDEATRLFEATVEAQTRVLGRDHAHTLATRNNYASMLSRLGDDAAAEPIFRATIVAHTRLMGELHPMCKNLAQCLANQARV
jgi:hypothetical protein